MSAGVDGPAGELEGESAVFMRAGEGARCRHEERPALIGFGGFHGNLLLPQPIGQMQNLLILLCFHWSAGQDIGQSVKEFRIGYGYGICRHRGRCR